LQGCLKKRYLCAFIASHSEDTIMPWNPDLYHKFQAQRAAPFEDLFALVNVRDGLRVVDLGCGTGELTAQLAARLPYSTVVGVDSSPQMLAKAAAHVRPGLSFEQGRIEDVRGEWDLVFSHAAIQWVDDHAALIPHLLSLVAPGGQLAVQQPSNHTHYSHLLPREIAAEEPFASALSGWSRVPPVLGIEEYAKLLYDNGVSDMVIFEKVYPHILDDADAIADWTSGTLLVPYMERLPEALREPFMQAYRARLRVRFPESPVFYGFRRTLFAATRPTD
jgi:trans-aconitate 2-methyltransferase